MATDLLLGVGTAAQLPCDAALPLRDAHPLTHPGFQWAVTVDEGIVTSADPRVGLMHRSAEKLFESRDYRQAMLLANRHDWLSAFSSEVGIALALESALGIAPPERATWIRTLLAEANRLFALLAFVAPVAGEQRTTLERLRERLSDVQEEVTGGRIHPGFARIGGVAAPIGKVALAQYLSVMDDVEASWQPTHDALSTYAEPLAGVAVLRRADALAFGVSGVVGRASGLDLDLRRDDPYLAYDRLGDLMAFEVRHEGDVPARYECIIDQLRLSSRLVRACVDEVRRLGDGPVDVPLPKVVRLPEGTTYAWVEGPLGISGALVVSTGDKAPWRLKIRSASFATMQAMAGAVVGTRLTDLSDALMSFPMVMGDVDR